jgi:hypothetical protein
VLIRQILILLKLACIQLHLGIILLPFTIIRDTFGAKIRSLELNHFRSVGNDSLSLSRNDFNQEFRLVLFQD